MILVGDVHVLLFHHVVESAFVFATVYQWRIQGVSLVATETPFSAARLCVAIADRALSISRASQTDALKAAPFQPSILR